MKTFRREVRTWKALFTVTGPLPSPESCGSFDVSHSGEALARSLCVFLCDGLCVWFFQLDLQRVGPKWTAAGQSSCLSLWKIVFFFLPSRRHLSLTQVLKRFYCCQLGNFIVMFRRCIDTLDCRPFWRLLLYHMASYPHKVKTLLICYHCKSLVPSVRDHKVQQVVLHNVCSSQQMKRVHLLILHQRLYEHEAAAAHWK